MSVIPFQLLAKFRFILSIACAKHKTVIVSRIPGIKPPTANAKIASTKTKIVSRSKILLLHSGGKALPDPGQKAQVEGPWNLLILRK